MDVLIMESIENRIKQLVEEEIKIVPYNANWPRMFELERDHLIECLPHSLIKRIEHFGSTAIPGLSAKPIIDILVEVNSFEETKKVIVPILTSQGYEYFWRPTFGNDVPPFYAWFIKRDSQNNRTHHIHMVEKEFEHWDRLLFRDYLIEHPDLIREYENIKISLAEQYQCNRIAYTESKAEFIVRVTCEAKKYYESIKPKNVLKEA
jgi:GrpB-like predicted nucleotidyltransferase (UPF0157 family)